MGKPTGFMEFTRETPKRKPVSLRIKDWQEIYEPMAEEALKTQGARCMNCGIPFCSSGCPLGNLMPEWNDLVYKGKWREAIEMLHKTNNFPEFTGRVCPAPCEESCVLGIKDPAVAIKTIEMNIIERAFAEGWVVPNPPKVRTGKKVAVVGSGPSGLACAAQLNKAGHKVTVYERADRVGGLLMYGIPQFKLEKNVVQRRVDLLKAEGVEFVVNANVGFNVKVEDLRKNFDAIVLCGGSTLPRDLAVPGRELKGIYYAMEYLPQRTQAVLGDKVKDAIDAKGKNVIIIGGGDTGADCLGSSIRQGCKSVKQFELLPKPPAARGEPGVAPWPLWPMIFRTSSAHEEATEIAGADVRDFAVSTQKFTGENGVVKKLHGVKLNWSKDANGRMQMKEIPGTEFVLDCDLCFLAMGFVSPEHNGPIQQLGVKVDGRGNVQVDPNFQTSVPGVFSAGDMRRGQSLVVWAITEGRQAARCVDEFLMGASDLPKIPVM